MAAMFTAVVPPRALLRARLGTGVLQGGVGYGVGILAPYVEVPAMGKRE